MERLESVLLLLLEVGKDKVLDVCVCVLLQGIQPAFAC